jgi:D-alanyl-D-alanine-carboxypeptidase/D-alanyl-D-alanine-endopeptidase
VRFLAVRHSVMVLILLTVAVGAKAQFSSFKENSITKYLRKSGTRSLVIAVIKDTARTIKFYGKINKTGAKNTVPDGNTVFEIGSITKIFTTFLLADLVSKDSISLNDSVVDFLPSNKNYSERLKKISLLNLATHTSGLPRVTALSLGNSFTFIDAIFNSFNPYRNYDEKKLLIDMRNPHFASIPGDSYKYSNLGLGLLGYALTRAAKKNYDIMLRENIFEPLMMKNTSIRSQDIIKDHLAIGHNSIGIRMPRWTFQDGMQAAGCINSCANDLLNFLEINLVDNNSHIREMLVLCQKTYFKVDDNLEIGLGWHKSSRKDRDYSMIYHNGRTGGFSSFLGFNRESKTGVIVLSNCSRNVDSIGLDILDQLIHGN